MAAEPGHEPVAGAGAEAGADVQPEPMAITTTPASIIATRGHERLGLGNERQEDVDDEADRERVQDRAEAWRLAERDPQEQQERRR